eukprot:1153672-Pelagomonas_calceolata.AAC.1
MRVLENKYAEIFSGGLLQGVLWFKMMGPYRYTRLVPVSIVEPHTSYTIQVKTSDIPGAGTDANVLITIFGIKNGKWQWHHCSGGSGVIAAAAMGLFAALAVAPFAAVAVAPFAAVAVAPFAAVAVVVCT